MATASRRYCVRCGRLRLPGEFACPAPCGCDLYDRTVGGHVQAPQGPEAGAQLLGILSPIALPPGAVLLLSGGPGSGKSTVGLQALSPPRGGSGSSSSPEAERASCPPLSPGPLVIAIEMGVGLTLAYARRLGVQISEISEIDPVNEAGELTIPTPKDRAVPMLLDSLTATGDPGMALATVRAWTRRTAGRAICTVQVTKEGDPRGPKTLEHDCDIHVALGPGDGYSVATVQKNRFGPLLSFPFVLTENGASLPKWDRYYSIEGRFPSFSLVSFPSGGRYADPYRHRAQLPEDLPLPPPPLAVAAERSPLSPSGWQAPGDVAHRAAFAARVGLPFLRIG